MKVIRSGSIAFVLLISVAIIVGTIACSVNTDNYATGATDVIRKYLEAKKNNDFESWKSTLWTYDENGSLEKEGDLGVIDLSISNIYVSDKESENIKDRYTGSELAENRGWTDEYIASNIVAVYAQYTVDYDNTKVPYNEGDITQYFYLVRADQESPWLIWDQSYDVNE